MMLYDCVVRYGSRPMAKRPALVEKVPWRVLQASRLYLTAWGVGGGGGGGEEEDTCILMEGVYKLGRHASSMPKHTFFVIARCTRTEIPSALQSHSHKVTNEDLCRTVSAWFHVISSRDAISRARCCTPILSTWRVHCIAAPVSHPRAQVPLSLPRTHPQTLKLIPVYPSRRLCVLRSRPASKRK